MGHWMMAAALCWGSGYGYGYDGALDDGGCPGGSCYRFLIYVL